MIDYGHYNTNGATIKSVNGTLIPLDGFLRGAIKATNWLFYKKNAIGEGYMEDLVQDCALKLLTMTTYDEKKASPETFGYRVALNRAYELRSQAAHYGVTYSEIIGENDENNSSFMSYKSNPEWEAISREDFDRIHSVISYFEMKDRMILEMTIRGEKPKDIAKVLGCTPGFVSTRLFRLRKKIMEELRDLLREFRMPQCA